MINSIPVLESEGHEIRSQKGKANIFWKFYIELMGTTSQKVPKINWNNLYGDVMGMQ